MHRFVKDRARRDLSPEKNDIVQDAVSQRGKVRNLDLDQFCYTSKMVVVGLHVTLYNPAVETAQNA